SAPARLARPDLPVRPAQLKRRGRPRPHADARSTFVTPRYAGPISTSRSPAATEAPATAGTLVTRPATSAASVLSIFIASRPASVRGPSRRRVSTSAPEAPGAERLPRRRRGGAAPRLARRRGRPRERQRGGERRDRLVAARLPGREVLGQEARVRLGAAEGRVREHVLQEGEVGRGTE